MQLFLAEDADQSSSPVKTRGDSFDFQQSRIVSLLFAPRCAKGDDGKRRGVIVPHAIFKTKPQRTREADKLISPRAKRMLECASSNSVRDAMSP